MVRARLLCMLTTSRSLKSSDASDTPATDRALPAARRISACRFAQGRHLIASVSDRHPHQHWNGGQMWTASIGMLRWPASSATKSVRWRSKKRAEQPCAASWAKDIDGCRLYVSSPRLVTEDSVTTQSLPVCVTQEQTNLCLCWARLKRLVIKVAEASLSWTRVSGCCSWLRQRFRCYFGFWFWCLVPLSIYWWFL